MPDSWFERMVETCLVTHGLSGLQRQHEIRDGAGAFVARVDLAFPAVKLAVEAHSRQFHFGSRAEAFDQRRDNRLAALGWEVIYVGWQAASTTPGAVAKIIHEIVRAHAIL